MYRTTCGGRGHARSDYIEWKPSLLTLHPFHHIHRGPQPKARHSQPVTRSPLPTTQPATHYLQPAAHYSQPAAHCHRNLPLITIVCHVQVRRACAGRDGLGVPAAGYSGCWHPTASQSTGVQSPRQGHVCRGGRAGAAGCCPPTTFIYHRPRKGWTIGSVHDDRVGSRSYLPHAPVLPASSIRANNQPPTSSLTIERTIGLIYSSIYAWLFTSFWPLPTTVAPRWPLPATVAPRVRLSSHAYLLSASSVTYCPPDPST